jgi:hypothetical protein
MPLKSTQTLFVIFTRPQPQARSDTQYIGTDGSTTPSRSHAARFWTYWDAKAYAAEHHMTLDALTYIGREDFTHVET